MTHWLEWLLDLERINIARDAPLALRWQGGIAAWILFGISLVAIVVIILVYRRERTSTGVRVFLALVRCMVAGLTILLFCQPALVLQRNRLERSQVAVLVDVSESMSSRDAGGDGTTAVLSRLDTVKDALQGVDGSPLSALLGYHQVHVYAFSSEAHLQAFAGEPVEASHLVDSIVGFEADGLATDLTRAIATALDDFEGRRLAGIVLASDGRSSTGTPPAEAARLAGERHVPLFPILVGSARAPMDIVVGPLQSQEQVFVNDWAVVGVEVSATGLTESTPLQVQLIEQESGRVVDQQEVVFAPGGEDDDEPWLRRRVEFRYQPRTAGMARLRAQVAPLPNESSAGNNQDTLELRVRADSVKVLYVDGYPRFEYRYLKNALLREPSMETSILLLEADERFVQEGSEPIRRFPETGDELNRYDVVLFGDVDPRSGWLSLGQMDLLVEFVSLRGGGFAAIAGERSTPHRWADTPLEKLLPVKLSPTGESLASGQILRTGYLPQLTPEGEASRIFRLAGVESAVEDTWRALPALYWAARVEGARPGATVLSEHPALDTVDGPLPLVITSRFGAGKILYQGTDDTWRWRRHTGELLHDTYWVQIVRSLLPDTGISQDRRFTLRSDRRVYTFGSTAELELEILDPALAAQLGDTTRARVEDDAGRLIRRIDLVPLGSQSDRFVASFTPPRPGRYRVFAEDIPERPGVEPTVLELRAERPALEQQRPAADHDTLRRLAHQTGGGIIDLEDLEGAFRSIPDRSAQVPDDVIEPLWDSKLALLLFALMISLEWIGRKAANLQ